MSDFADLTPIIEKIRKLLALSNSPNVNEAALAMSKVQELLTAYNLEMRDVQTNTEDVTKQTYLRCERISDWRYTLFCAICPTYYCVAFKDAHTGYVNWQIVGRPINVKVAWMMLDYLFETVERLSKALGGSGKSEKLAYKKGVADTLSLRLSEIRVARMKNNTSCTALVVQDKELIKEFLGSTILVDQKFKDLSETAAYAAGRKDGHAVGLGEQLTQLKRKVLK